MNTSLGSSITIPVQLKGTGGGGETPPGRTSQKPREEKGNYKGKTSRKIIPAKNKPKK
jgi:hypothetical protein